MACLEGQATGRGIVLDPAQRAAAAALQTLHDGLLARPFGHGVLPRHLFRRKTPRGVYLWGGVGRGKSFLMDAFFACIPLARKRRLHFHHFMQEIHARLAAMKGQRDPLSRLAREIAGQTRLLCLDEFHITDITDAMLMRGLLQGLFENGVALVATANAHPDDLYRDGLQRGQFLPAIAWLKNTLDVVRLDGGEDYRLRLLEQAGLYHAPLDEVAESALAGIFASLSGLVAGAPVRLEVEGRAITARAVASGVAWFDFDALCAGPRGKADYIELARRFHTVLISGVPRFGPPLAAQARRFLWLVDEFYDRRVKLVLSAATPLRELDRENLLQGEFARALSRLAEMQSRDYLAR